MVSSKLLGVMLLWDVDDLGRCKCQRRVRNCISLVFAVFFSWFVALGSDAAFNPVDNFLIACGSSKNITFEGRTFVPDSRHSSFRLKSDGSSTIFSSNSSVPFPIYKSMRFFTSPASYEFDIAKKGRHWLRLYFYPSPHSDYNFESALITVFTDKIVLLNNFSFTSSNQSSLFKEYVINVNSSVLTITFIPSANSVTFINGIEVVSVPDEVFSDQLMALAFSGPFRGPSGISEVGLETVYRLNVGGPLLTPQNDTQGRTWENDHKYLDADFRTSTVNVSTDLASIIYANSITPQTAPKWVYATAVALGRGPEKASSFNITWVFTVDPSFGYLVRLHFCDVISLDRYKLIFDVFINYQIAMPNLDLSTINGNFDIPYFRDFIFNDSSIDSSTLSIGVGSSYNVTLNGLEIMKISNGDRSLHGISSVTELLSKRSPKRKGVGNLTVIAAGGSACATILICLCFCCVLYRRSKAASPRKNSWLTALASIWKLQNYDNNSGGNTSRKGGTVGSILSPSSNVFRIFSFKEIMDATRGFDEKLLLGVGGFGRVYMGTLEDGTNAAIKRADPRSRQGSYEFETEIKILQKVRHRHLVSLLGYCDEQSEMILIYEYMANGTLRSHLYGKDFPPLSWKQRLEICIGAARGLHYLHTGAAQNIIHRDVKSTNILLDENFVPKVADFGLSKMGPGTHASTCIKGTFGYLDPEYIRKQHLTAKSDQYSFGVVLMEVLCARPVFDDILPIEEAYIVDWAISRRKKGKLEQIMDPDLIGKGNYESVNKFIEIAEKCLAQRGVDRPTMGNVLSNLEYALQLENGVPAELEDSSTDTGDSFTSIDISVLKPGEAGNKELYLSG